METSHQSINLEVVPTWNKKKILADIASAQSTDDLRRSIITQAEVCTFIIQQVSFELGPVWLENHIDDLFETLEKPYWFAYIPHRYDDDIAGRWIYILAEITAQYARKDVKLISPYSAAYAIRHCIDDIASPILTAEEKALKTSPLDEISNFECVKTLLTANTNHLDALLELGIFKGKISMNRADFLKSLFKNYPKEYIRRKPIKTIAIAKEAADGSQKTADALPKQA